MPRRGLPKWLKIAIIVVLVLANLGALGIFWALNTGQDILALATTDQEVVSELTEATGDSLVFLVVGSDSREGLDSLKNFGSAGGRRGDVIMLIRLDQTTSRAQMLSIPRDLWVDIPGQGKGKINAAYAYGGPALMVQTIRENLGIEVNHYVEVGFVGFIAMVDELGGIEMSFPYSARDVSSGLRVEGGTQVVDGYTALAYARSRKYQEHQNGNWVSVDASDIGRTQRQQQVVRAILIELKTPSSITEAGQIAGSLAQHMTIDATLAESSVAGMAWDFRGLLTGSIDGQTLPVYGDTIDGASVVIAEEPAASAMIADFLGGSPTVSSAPIRIQVLNGNGITGAAGRMSATLEEAGFEVASLGNADSRDYTTTAVLVPAGSDAGERIVTELGFGVVEVVSVDNGYDAVVIVGADAS
ncbi:MAG TPA: LCP family protein [Acidimicrobiia bacterium]|nr:LCP family protein [Acidimicrobiia bacterium]